MLQKKSLEKGKLGTVVALSAADEEHGKKTLHRGKYGSKK
jgi:hypothetical protein